MVDVDLREYGKSDVYRLTASQRGALTEALPSLTIESGGDTNGEFTLTPSSIVGAVNVSGLSVRISPKIGIPKLLALACYALRFYDVRDLVNDLKEEETLPDALALALGHTARRAFAGGLMHDYLTRDESLHTVRGRIRFDEQLRRRFSLPLPVEVRYDDYTDDILPNRLVKAAALRLRKAGLRGVKSKRELAWIAGVLDNVTPTEFSRRELTDVKADDLSARYRDIVRLSCFILRRGAYESARGEVRSTGFTMDMNQVFQEFVTVALREKLGLSERAFKSEKQVWLDRGEKIRTKPDLSWWENGKCVFVGDAKYKNIAEKTVPPTADLYQMLAYVTALNLPRGLLIYAKDEAQPAAYQVRHSGKWLEIAALDLSGSLEEVLERVNVLASMIKAMRL